MSLLPKNIRSRLALGYAVAVAVTVLVYASVVYGFTRSALLDQLDARLHDDFERAEYAFEIAMDGAISWKDPRGPTPGDHSAEGQWVEIQHPADGADLRWPERRAPEVESSRVYARDYVVAGEAYRIRVGRSLAPIDAELNALLRLLALCFVPVVALAWMVGHLLARRALRPVDVMTERARHIGAERLSERLPVANENDELGRLAIVFNDAFARIERAFERLQRFTSDAAHELRTPLAALRSVGEVGLDLDAGAEANREVIASMLEETGRLTRLVEELLVLSRGDALIAPPEVEQVDLHGLAESVCEQLEVLAAERDQELVVEGSPATTLAGNRMSLRRALINLVDNAIRHGPASSRIRVRISADPGEIVLSVIDEGPGIDPEHRSRIFDRFYQVDASRAGSGTGLGLSLAAQAAKLHAGRIELDASRSEGTTFRITLPRR